MIARGVTPPNNIGPRTTPNYRQLAQNGVTNLARGGKVFAGQREDAFFADIGAIFDLVAIRKGMGNMGGGKDFFAGYAVHGIALQIPISQLDDSDHGGVWATTERPRLKIRAYHRNGVKRFKAMAVAPGLAPGQPTDQRSDHPDQAQGPLEPLGARTRMRSSCSTTASRCSPRSSTSSTDSACRRRTVTTSLLSCSRASRA